MAYSAAVYITLNGTFFSGHCATAEAMLSRNSGASEGASEGVSEGASESLARLRKYAHTAAAVAAATARCRYTMAGSGQMGCGGIYSLH